MVDLFQGTLRIASSQGESKKRRILIGFRIQVAGPLAGRYELDAARITTLGAVDLKRNFPPFALLDMPQKGCKVSVDADEVEEWCDVGLCSWGCLCHA